jgi:hypothetical protein
LCVLWRRKNAFAKSKSIDTVCVWPYTSPTHTCTERYGTSPRPSQLHSAPGQVDAPQQGATPQSYDKRRGLQPRE